MEIFLGIVYVGRAVNILDAPLLPGLGPLAGEEDHRGHLAAHHRLADGLPPVGDDGVVTAPLLHILGDVPADLLHRLLPGVLFGEDDQVGILTGNLPQVLPAVIGLVARAAEDGDDPPAGVFLPDRLEEGLKGQPVVGIVHDDGDLFIGVGVDLHPSGDPGLHQTREGVLLRHPHRLAHRQGGQGVLDIEQAGHGQPELPAVPGGLDPEKDVSPHFADLGAEDGGRRVLLGEGNHSRAAPPGRLQHPVGVVAVQVHAGRGGLGKNPQLGGKIVLEIRVLNGRDVVHADVQEDRGGKLHVFHPVILQRLAGDLHGEVPHAGGHPVGKVALQVQGLWGGQVGLKLLHPVIGLNGGDHPAGGLALGGQVLVKDIL
ncbi:unknown [Firmicutes bacterium CAG:114]|nr:unknown [Firmicutes bacterium CAG:114]